MAEPQEADDLYGVPLAEFTPARNALAARLRKQGDRASGEAVKKLAKPSISAWALNQVARRQPKLVDRLLEAAAELRRAQQALMSGRGQDAFRESTQAERNAAGELVRAAAAVLEQDGHPANKAILDRLEATAHAAAAHPEGADLLRAGRLTVDLNPAGFGGLEGGPFGLPAEPIPFPKRPRLAEAPGKQPTVDQRQHELEQARVEVHRLQRELRELRQQAGEAEDEASRARQAAAKADGAWAEAREAAARAEKAAAQARRVEEDAATELAAVRARIDAASDELQRAEHDLRRLRDA